MSNTNFINYNKSVIIHLYDNLNQYFVNKIDKIYKFLGNTWND